MAGEKERAEAYISTVKRMEPDVTPTDRDPTLASIAISLKRIADELERFRHMAEADNK